MKRLLIALVVLSLAGPLADAATPLFISADVPTTESASATTWLPDQMVRYTSAPSYALALNLPGAPTLDGIHKMDMPKNWLFSVESANNLAGVLGGADAFPRDVIRVDTGTGTYSVYFCGASLGIPLEVNVDAVYLDGGDAGDLILSFDVPVTLGPFSFDPADLVRYDRTGVGCGGWTLVAANPDFDASAAGSGIPTSANVIGAARIGTRRILSFETPTDLAPPGFTVLPGQIVSWDGAVFAPFEFLAGWPIASEVDGLSLGANPGVIPPTLKVNKTVANQLDLSDIVLVWSGSCSDVIDYGIYEGSMGTWPSHTRKDCTDNGTPLTEQITPLAGNRYYLVVPHNGIVEGSYGLRRDNMPLTFTERTVGALQCFSPQVVTPCP